MKTFLCVCVLGFLCFGFAAFGQSAAGSATAIDVPEFQARRAAALAKVPDGIILLRSAWGMKHWDESGFHQDPSFYYFSGLANAHAPILALDGTTKESWLFVPPRLPFGTDLHGFDAVFFDPGAQTEKELGIDHVVAWDQLVTFIEGRRRENPKLVLYTDRGGQTGWMAGDDSLGTPPGLVRRKTQTRFGRTCCARIGRTWK